MRFLLRMAFWLGVILVMLPRGESTPTSSAQIGAMDAVSAATATVGDLRQFCGRQPEACTVGSQAAVALGDRAKAGAKRLYDMLNERLTANENDGITTATSAGNGKTIPLPPVRPSQPSQHVSQNPSQNASQAQPASQSQHMQYTLTPADQAPAWRGTQPRKEAHARPA
jgi:Family of unknown function (DUF5330)